MITYQYTDELPDEPIRTDLLTLLLAVFGTKSRPEWLAELTYQQERTPVRTWLAFDGERLIGCKLGYERGPDQFYSWLGGVDAAYRGRGIAGELMQQQHDWCRRVGYRSVRTQTYNQWRSMLILNLRHGFAVIGTVQGKHGLTIMLEKLLT